MSQLNYDLNPPNGRAGSIAEMRESNVVISKLAEGLVQVGLLVAPGTSPEVGMSPTTANPKSTTPGTVRALPVGIVDDPILDSEFLGVSLVDSSRPPYTSLDEYADKDYVPVMRKGVVWVFCETAATQYADVFVRVTAGGGFNRGSFRVGAAANFVKLARGRWQTSTTASGLAILEIW